MVRFSRRSRTISGSISMALLALCVLALATVFAGCATTKAPASSQTTAGLPVDQLGKLLSGVLEAAGSAATASTLTPTTGLTIPPVSSTAVVTSTTSKPPVTGRWYELAPRSPLPSARDSHAMCYASDYGLVYLFGGAAPEGVLGDTWAYDPAANAWMYVDPGTSAPAARFGAAMVYDPATGTVILFGGRDEDLAYYTSTWAFNPAVNAWTELDSFGPTPPARDSHAMCYNPDTGLVILFGGSDAAGTTLNDTWAYNPVSDAWTQLDPLGNAPPARVGAAMVYDPETRTVILFGGADGGDTYSDTWAYDPKANRWTELAPARSVPPARDSGAMVYDPVFRRAILFGGVTPNGILGDTWAYDPAANTWTRLNPGGELPRERAWHVMVYDSLAGNLILFGGFNVNGSLDDTWAFGR